MRALDEAIEASAAAHWTAAPTIGVVRADTRDVRSPTDRRIVFGAVVDAVDEDVDRALDTLVPAQREWDARPATERAAVLDRAAALTWPVKIASGKFHGEMQAKTPRPRSASVFDSPVGDANASGATKRLRTCAA